MKKTIKLLAVILSVCILLCSLPMTAFALDENMPEVESVQVADMRISQGNTSRGIIEEHMNEDGTVSYWTHYSISTMWDITVVLKDGTVLKNQISIVPLIEYNDKNYFGDYTDPQSYENQWGVGEHTVNFSIMGFDTSFKVIIESNHITDIKVHDVTVYDGLDSYTETDWTEEGNIEYKAYRLNNIKFDIEFDDGYKETNTTWCYHNDTSFGVRIIDDMQSAGNEWQIGNTYQVPVSLGEIISNVNVTVAPNPLKSVEFEDTSVIFGSGAYGHYEYYPNVKLTFDDGTVMEKSSREGVVFNYNWYSFSFDDTQYETIWEEGGTYNVTGTVMGVSGNFKVTILPSPIEKIELSDIYVVEELDGFYSTSWAHDSPEEYFKYSYSNNGKVTFKDGTTQKIQGSSFYYQNEWYYISQIDNQETEHWQVGNTYKVTATLLGCSTEFNVEVRELPYTSLQVDDIVLAESAKSGSTYGYTPIFRFTHKDGTVYTSNERYPSIPMYDSTSSSFINISGDNQYFEPWTVGNTYKLTASFGKLSADFNVTISSENVCDGFTYITTADGLIITDCPADNETITVPTQLDGKAVIGISTLGQASCTVKELTIPDGIKFVSNDLFTYIYEGYIEEEILDSDNFPIKTIRIGKDVEYFDASMLEYCYKLENIFISKDNNEYCDIDGVMFNKAKTVLVWYPLARDKEVVLPATIEDFSIIYYMNYPYCGGNYYVVIDGESENYVAEDGVTYNSDKTAVICCDRNKSGNYVMPDSVLTIKPLAFFNCKKLENIKVSGGVTEIAYATFAGCDALETLSLPTELKSLGKYAVCDCPSIKSITLPDKLQFISGRCFTNDTELESINFPTSLSLVDYEAFSNTGFVELNLPDTSLIEGFGGAFLNCQKLKSVKMAEGSTIIEGNMFTCCPLLENFIMPNSIVHIGYESFRGCESLKTINLSNNLRSIYALAFAETGLESIILPDSIEFMDEDVFSDCTNLKTAKIGSGLSELPRRTFMNTALEKIEIPENIKYIGGEVFFGCENLTDVSIENENAEIYEGAFSGCPLKNIPIPTNATVINGETYKGSKAKSVTIPNSVTDIMYGAFEDSTDLLDITMPTHLDSLGRAAFDNTAWYNTKLDGYITIDDYILYGYKGDYAGDPIINIDKSISLLAGGVFENGLHGDTSKIERIIIPDGVKAIPENAFDGCTNLKSVTIPKSIESIYLSNDNDGILHSAFNNCPSLTDIYYLGTQQQWNELFPEYSLDRYRLPNATIHFIDEIVPFRISVEESQTKKVYEINENFKSDEFAIRVLFSDGTEKTLTEGFIVSGFDSSTLGTNNLTVSYGELTCTCPITIEPHKVATSGKCGENITWKLNLDTGILNISGNGDMYDYANTDTPWFESLSDINSVVFGKDVTTISAGTFSNCENLKSITVYNANAVINDYIDNFITVIGNYGSKAHRYAIKNGYEFTPFPETIEIFALPKQIVYAVGEDFDTNGLAISVCNPNGTVEYRNKGFTVSGYDNEKVGKQTLTVEYLEMSANFEIEVKDGILISNPNAQDLTRLRKMLLETEKAYFSYDFNGDGVIDIRDLVRMKKYLADNTTPLGKQKSNTQTEQSVTEIANIPESKEIA